MELIIDTAGITDPIDLNHNANNFKVSFIAIADGFSGKWSLEFSPNGTDWISHEDLTDQTGGAVNNLYFQIPYVRINASGMTGGKLKAYLYGSVE